MTKTDNKRSVLLGQPSYGRPTDGAARAFYTASRDPLLEVNRRVLCGSLLAQQCNGIWAMALNVQRVEPVDYFAMLHSDVEPEPGWLDVLIAELEANELDVLSVAVPIKDQKGLTSTALERDDGDQWRPHCRITMRELYELPETFTAADTGRPLLFNTGCFVCKFDRKWVDQVHFEINDRIVFNTSLDRYMAEVEPEDWFFSRLCNELDLRVGVTRKIRLTHDARFSNAMPWGTEDFDSTYVKSSSIEATPGLFRFPYDVEGWLLPEEGRALAELAEGKRVLEVGSYCGRSTICLAQTAEHVVSVDPHDGRGTPRPRDTYQEFRRNLKAYDVSEKVASKSLEAPITLEYDLIFIDGEHSYEGVQRDIDRYSKNLAGGGVFAFHDYRTTPGQHDGNWDPGVTKAVDEWIENGAELIQQTATVAVLRPPALSGVNSNG